MRLRAFGLLVPSILLAYVVVEWLVPTPNAAGGGAAKMCLIIFAAVGIKATIEYFLSRWTKKKHESQIDKPAD
jgi:hypothetical protein